MLCGLFVGACLREDGLGPRAGAGGEARPADNSFCYVCHANYKREELAQHHAAKGVGCMTCHGDSDAHSSDEDGLTPPDVMYPEDRINPSCMKCHARKALAGVRAHGPVLAGKATESGQKRCTDCHGDHRLKVRTRRWDKATGRLTADDGVRMTGSRPVHEN